MQGYQTLVDDPDVDAVYIPLPNALHAEWTTQALRAGKPVLCEKPLCGSLAETEQVLAVARETGTPLWEAFVFPFHEQMAKVRGLLADGAIGELREIQSSFSFVLDHPGDFRLRRGMAGGALNDVGCYPVRLAVELFTGEVESALATATLGGDGVDVDLQGIVDYSGHQRLIVSCSFLRSDDRFSRLLGTAGQIHLTDPFHPGPDDSFTVFEEGKEPRVYASTDEVPSFTAAIRHIQRVARGRSRRATWRWTTHWPAPGRCTRCTRPRPRPDRAAGGSDMPSDGDQAPGDLPPGDLPAGDLPAGEAAAIRDALAAERQQTLDRMTAVSREFDGIVAASEGVATDDEHDPEGATIAFERAQLAALADQAREHLAELDEALDRLRQGRYGRCERCGQPIAAGRLAARPAARTCIACAAVG